MIIWVISLLKKQFQKLNKGISPINANITILGLSFKENCPDLRNTKVITIIRRLKHYNCNLTVSDPYALPSEAKISLELKLQKI